MNLVILGAGNLGFQLARQLIEEDKNVVLIERDPEKAKHAANTLDCIVINEEGNNLDTLKRAGVAKADYFIAVTDSDEINMIACGMVSSEFEVPNKIARIRNIDYSSTRVLQYPFLGIDYVLNPEIEASRSVINAIEKGAVSDVSFFERSGLQMRSFTIGPNYPFIEKTVEELKQLVEIDFLVAVILRENRQIIPRGDTRLKENDKLYLIASEDNFGTIFSKIGKGTVRLKKIVLFGGGRVGRYVVDHFLGQKKRGIFGRIRQYFRQEVGRNITIIDRDYQNCKEISEIFPQALVINADISDEGFAEEEQLSDADLVITATENQELNIVNAVYAKNLGIQRSIALVNKSSYLHIASTIGIDVTISPIDSMVSSILKYMRKDSVRSVHPIPGGKVEVLELTIDPVNKMGGKVIKDLKLPANTLILSVTRDEHDIIPNGSMELYPGDSLIVISRKEAVQKIEEIFTS